MGPALLPHQRYAVALGVLVALPCLVTRYYNDDYTHRMMLAGLSPGIAPSPFGLYDFTRGPAHVQALAASGSLPWWVPDSLHFRFFRPLGSALVAFDHTVSPTSAVWSHLHGLLWLAALLFAAAAAFRVLLPSRAAIASTVAYALATHHLSATLWPSARPGLAAGTFAVAAFATHLRARVGGARVAWASLALLALGFCTSELALGAVAMIAAWELVAAPGERRVRAMAALPVVALCGVYLALYTALGGGTRGSGMYRDPVHETSAYFHSLVVRWPVLLADPVTNIPSEALMVAPQASVGLALLALLCLGALALRVVRGRAARGTDATRTLAALALGATAATLPGASAVPGGRVMIVAGLGVAALVGTALTELWELRATQTGLRRVYTTALAVALCVPMVVVSPLVHVAMTAGVKKVGDVQAAIERDTPWRCERDAVGVILTAADPSVAMYTWAILATTPRHGRALHVLSWAPYRHALRRDDARTLSLTLLDGGRMLTTPLETVFRSPRFAFHVGERFVRDGATVTVTAMDGPYPTALRVRTDEPIAEPRVCLFTWRDGALRAVQPPAVGETVVLPHDLGPMGL